MSFLRLKQLNMYFSDELNRILIFLTLLNYAIAINLDNTYATTHISSSECYDSYGQPRVRTQSEISLC